MLPYWALYEALKTYNLGMEKGMKESCMGINVLSVSYSDCVYCLPCVF